MKPSLTFVYHHPEPYSWRDGLWAALRLLENDFEISRVNLAFHEKIPEHNEILLAWGAFESPAERAGREVKAKVKALQIGGTAQPPLSIHAWDVVFPETNWHLNVLRETGHKKLFRAFGTNMNIYKPLSFSLPKIFSWISVGAFARWKRHHLLAKMADTVVSSKRCLVIGEIQQQGSGRSDSEDIIRVLLELGLMISPFVEPEKLAELYNLSAGCYIGAGLHGGGERSVLEAKACGVPVVVELDNPKLIELAAEPEVLSHIDFARSLKIGIASCLLQ